MGGVLGVGISGLRVAQMGLHTASHNIANASTAGYSRQEIFQTTNQSNLTVSGYFGQGANVSTIKRVYNEYLTSQIHSAEANVGELDTYLAQARQIDNLLADEHAGLSPALSSFFQAVQQMAAEPASVSGRQSLISSAQALVARFSSLDQRMGEIRDGVNTQLVNQVTTINAYVKQISEFNDRVVRASAVAQGNPPNDMLDQRDQMIRDLNSLIKVNAIPQSDGSINVFIGNGQAVVVGTTTYTMVADTVSAEDPERITVTMKAPNGSTVAMPESLLQGGALGGMLRFRNETLDIAQNGLGKVATAVANSFNAQHRMGIDLDGVAGLDFFTAPQPLVLANTSNTGGATLNVNIISSDYKIDFGAGSITRLSDGTDVTGQNPNGGLNFPIIVDGITISNPAGTPGGADTFIVKPGGMRGQRVIASSDNSGDATLDSTASNVQNLPAVSSDYRLSIGVGGTMQLVRLADSKSWSANDMADLQLMLAADPQGFVLNWEADVPAAVGDTFLIEPTRQAVRNLSVAIADPLKIAAASPFRTSASLNNEGTGKIDVGSVVALDPAGIPLPAAVTITYDAANDSLVLTGGINTTVTGFVPGQQNVVNLLGLRFTVFGVPADGDTFTLEANLNGVSDNRNAIALGTLQSTASLNNGSASYQAAYGQIVSYVGNRTREVEVTGQAQQTLADQAVATREEISGVNLDEEAANLMRYQQAYQASAKVMALASELFSVLLDLGR